MLSYIMKGMRRISHAFDSMFSITYWSITEEFNNISYNMDIEENSIMELGAGRRNEQCKCKMLVISDIDYEALTGNTSSRYKLIFNGNNSFPIRDESFDLIRSRFTFEHLQDTEITVSECARVLNKNGKMLMLFSSKNAEFSILNRILPESTKKVISLLFPNKESSKHGYIAYYDNCTLSSMSNVLERNHLTVLRQYHHYYSAPYFDFFPPLYFIILLYEQILSILDIHSLASYVFIEACKD